MMIIFHLRLFVSAIPVRRVRITCNAYAHTPNSKQIWAKNQLNWKRIRVINANWIRCRTWAKSNEYRNSKFYQNNNNCARPANAVNKLHRKSERTKKKTKQIRNDEIILKLIIQVACRPNSSRSYELYELISTFFFCAECKVRKQKPFKLLLRLAHWIFFSFSSHSHLFCTSYLLELAFHVCVCALLFLLLMNFRIHNEPHELCTRRSQARRSSGNNKWYAIIIAVRIKTGFEKLNGKRRVGRVLTLQLFCYYF